MLTNVFRAIVNRKILMDALKVMVNNLFKESFYRKRKKKQLILCLSAFSISYKSNVKTFLK